MSLSAQFVDSVSATAAVRLALSTGPFSIANAVLPPPTSPGENRVIELDLDIVAADESTLAAHLQTLHRELDRPTNVLRWASGNAGTVFFRTFRALDYMPDPVSVAEGTYSLRLTIRAEAFATGLRVDQNAVTVDSVDPAGATNPLAFDVLNVTGDVATPAFLRIQTLPSSAVPTSLVVAARRLGGATSSWPSDAGSLYRMQAETAVSVGTDTAIAGSADAAMSGSGGNYVRTTFATNASMVERLSRSSVVTPHVGLYWLYLRHRRSVAGDVIKGRVRTTIGTSSYTFDTVTHPANTTGPYWMRYALIQAPAGATPGDVGYAGADLSQTTAVWADAVKLDLQRVSGSGNVDTDAFTLVAAGQELATLDLSSYGIDFTTATNQFALVLDGPQDTHYTASGPALPTSPSGSFPTTPYMSGVIRRPFGSLPMLHPGRANRLWVMDTTPAQPVNAQIRVYVSFWPRYLYIAP